MQIHLYSVIQISLSAHMHVLVPSRNKSIFGGSFFVEKITGRLEAMLLEAKGSWELAEKAYTSLLEDNPLDQVNSLNLLGKRKRDGGSQLVA